MRSRVGQGPVHAVYFVLIIVLIILVIIIAVYFVLMNTKRRWWGPLKLMPRSLAGEKTFE